MFAVLASDSEGETEVKQKDVSEVKEMPVLNVKEEETQFRVWKADDTRFKNEDTTIIFKSPFSKKKNVWLKPRFKEEGDEWVSIESSYEAKVEVKAENDPEVEEKAVQKFPSLLTRGVTSEDKDRSTALAWAEKIKKSFDRADKSRFEFKKQPDPFVDKLSFFRRVTEQ